MALITYKHINFWKQLLILEDILPVCYDYLCLWIVLPNTFQASSELSQQMLVIAIVDEVTVHLVDKLLVRH